MKGIFILGLLTIFESIYLSQQLPLSDEALDDIPVELKFSDFQDSVDHPNVGPENLASGLDPLRVVGTKKDLDQEENEEEEKKSEKVETSVVEQDDSKNMKKKDSKENFEEKSHGKHEIIEGKESVMKIEDIDRLIEKMNTLNEKFGKMVNMWDTYSDMTKKKN